MLLALTRAGDENAMFTKVPPFEVGPSYMESSATVPTRPQTVYSI